MTEFFLALSLFLLSHSIPARPAVRERLAGALGERTYVLLYSALSLGLLAWLISAAMRAPVVPLWPLEPWQYYVPILLMLPAFILFAGGALSANPLSISFRRGFDPARPGFVAVTRHPILWGFALWSFAHVVPNGDLVPAIMFGGFGLFSLAGMALVDRRKRRQMGEEWQRLAARFPVVPFTGQRPAPGALLIPVLAGTFLYLALLHLHPLLFGPDPMAVLR